MNSLKRNYKLSDGALVKVAMRLVVVGRTDVSELEKYGWSAARIEQLQQMRLDLSNLATDAELLGMKQEAVAEKKKQRKRIFKFVRTEVMARVAERFGTDSFNYTFFRMAELKAAADTNFYFYAKRVVRIAAQLIPELAPQGLTQAIVDELNTMIDAYAVALEAIDIAIDERSMGLESRIMAGNALYAEMKLLANLGKRLWLNVNKNHHNKYVIYTEKKRQKK